MSYADPEGWRSFYITCYELHAESTGQKSPNSGLSEDNMSHAEVNASLCVQEEITIFGQQTACATFCSHVVPSCSAATW